MSLPSPFLLCLITVLSCIQFGLAQDQFEISDVSKESFLIGVPWGSLDPERRVYSPSQAFATTGGEWYVLLVRDISAGRTHRDFVLNNWRIIAISSSGSTAKQILPRNRHASFVHCGPFENGEIQVVVSGNDNVESVERFRINLDTSREIRTQTSRFDSSLCKFHPSIWSVFSGYSFDHVDRYIPDKDRYRSRFFGASQSQDASTISRGFRENSIVVLDNSSIDLFEMDSITGNKFWHISKPDLVRELQAKPEAKLKLWTAYTQHCPLLALPLFISIDDELVVACIDIDGRIKWTSRSNLEFPVESPVVSQSGRFVCGLFENNRFEGLPTRSRLVVVDLEQEIFTVSNRPAWGTIYVEDDGAILLGSNLIFRHSFKDINNTRVIWRAPQ